MAGHNLVINSVQVHTRMLRQRVMQVCGWLGGYNAGVGVGAGWGGGGTFVCVVCVIRSI